MSEHVAPQPSDGRSAASYEQLDSTRHEIRLLTLHPASDENDQICCFLSHAELNPENVSAAPVYEALSYVWGEPIFSEPILLNDQEFFITPSLKYALSCLRYKTESRVLWVDAVCINQSDIEERNQQVAMMREIYSRCQRDIAWIDPMIGRSFDSSQVAHSQLRSEGEEGIRKGMELMQKITARDSRTLKDLQNIPDTDGYFLDYGPQGHLLAVFDRPTIWKRLWVMQELSLAPRLTLVCKNAELDWDCLSALLKDEPYFDAFHMYRSHALRFPVWGEIFVTIKLIEDQRRLFREPGRVHSGLMDVVTRFREMDSTDPRDKIFGLLGLVTEDHGIEVDYTKSVAELYKETTLVLIKLSGNLDILCQNPFEGNDGHKSLQEAGQQNTPSWVAEFDAKHRDCVAPIFAQRDIFNAGLKGCETPCRLLGKDERILASRGTILGKIKPILQDPSHSYLAQSIMDLYFDRDVVLNPSEHIYAPSFNGKTVSTGESSIRAFWRTLVKDCTIPPRMRRLRQNEIEILDIANQERLREDEINVVSFQIASDRHESYSIFSYDLGDGFDYTDLDDGSNMTKVRNDISMREFMFVITENGLFVLARRHVKEDDVVAVLDGGKVPMILRKAEDVAAKEGPGDFYRVVCATYVHGFMYGEAEVGVEEGWLKKQDILLV